MARECPGCGKPVSGEHDLCPHCGARMAGATPIATGAPIATGSPIAGTGPGPRPGVSPRFDVTESLGTLGSTRAYLAVEKRTGAEVLLRLLPSSVAPGSDAVESLRSALTSVRGLEASPHIVRVLGVEREEPQAYLVVESFRGRTLMDRLRKERRLDPDEVIRLGLGIAAALQELHKPGIIHGELRPTNVLIGEEGTIHVTDVGIARELSHLASKGSSLAGPQRGVFYRPPEAGASDGPDKRHDLFALGCILFEAATGSRRLPAAWETVATKNPTPGVAYPDPCGENPELRKHLADVLRVFLAPNPRDRFPSVEDAIAALSGRSRPAPRVLPIMAPGSVGGGASPAALGLAEELRAEADAAGKRRSGAPPVARAALAAVGLLVVAALAVAGWRVLARDGAGTGPADDSSSGPAAPMAVPGLPPPLSAPPEDAPLPSGVHREGGRILGHRDGAELVLVPAGEYSLGEAGATEGNRRARRVRLPAFLVDRHEVTVGQFRLYAAAAGRAVPPQPAGSGDGHPVVGVTWSEAAAFAAWTGRRLPTEDEWEAAARGGGGRPFPWGAADEPRRRNGPGAEDGHAALAPATSYRDQGGAFGCFDLVGNAWEWCADAWSEEPGRAGAGPAPATAERAVRGGSWRVALPPAGAAFRNAAPPDVRWDDVGFRCAVSLPAGE